MHIIKNAQKLFTILIVVTTSKKIGVEKIDHALRLDPNLYC